MHRYHHALDGALPLKYRRVVERIRPGARVLDVGCHTGSLCRYLKAQGREVLGLEGDDAAARVAREQGVPVVTGDIASLDRLLSVDASFDHILCLDVLEHLVDPAEALRQLSSRLAPAGNLIVTGPNVAYWAMRKDLALGRFDYQETGILDRTHLRFYTLDGWRALLEQAGLRVVEQLAADGMLPLEHRIGAIPGAQPWVRRLSAHAVERWPRLVGIHLLFVAEPAHA